MKYKRKLQLIILPLIILPILIALFIFVYNTRSLVDLLLYELMTVKVESVRLNCKIEQNVVKKLGLESSTFYTRNAQNKIRWLRVAQVAW